MERCGNCKHHSEDGLFCENPKSYYYAHFRNDWKWCERYEKKEAQGCESAENQSRFSLMRSEKGNG